MIQVQFKDILFNRCLGVWVAKGARILRVGLVLGVQYPVEAIFCWFWYPVMSILYKNDRNVRSGNWEKTRVTWSKREFQSQQKIKNTVMVNSTTLRHGTSPWTQKQIIRSVSTYLAALMLKYWESGRLEKVGWVSFCTLKMLRWLWRSNRSKSTWNFIYLDCKSCYTVFNKNRQLICQCELTQTSRGLSQLTILDRCLFFVQVRSSLGCDIILY